MSDQRLGFKVTLLHKLIQSLPSLTGNTFDTLLLKTMFIVASYALLRISEIAITTNGSNNIISRDNLRFSYDKGKIVKASFKLVQFKHSQGETSTIDLKR